MVQEGCKVLKDHCVKSNAGLWYGSYAEFEAAVNYMSAHREKAEIMGEQGEKYVRENYSWPVIEKKYLDFLGSGDSSRG